MSDNKTSGKRKKDYVTRLAFGLFGFIILFELLIVTWLPRQLMNEKVWERDIAYQEMAALEDFLRRFIKGDLKYKNKWQEGEAYMALDCLNEYAKYMRVHRSDMSREQIREVYEKLRAFERRYNEWGDEKYSVGFEKLDVDPVLKILEVKFKENERKYSKKQGF
ncbi:MAG: hypothetical protein GXP32_03955 [Kiritimatiellaeota bacterium]|nr:hypothetical protein [Kiritimatiellota bacterium]